MKNWEIAMKEANDAFNNALLQVEKNHKKNQKVQQKKQQSVEDKTLSQVDFQADQTIHFLLSAVPKGAYDEKTFQNIEKLKVRYIPPDRKTKVFTGLIQTQKSKIVSIIKQIPMKNNMIPQGFKGKAEFEIQKDSKKERFTLQSDDLKKLNPNIDVNDTVIQNYIKMLKLFIIPSQILDKVFIYSSFFMSQFLGDLIQPKQDLVQKKQPEKKSSQDIKKKLKQNYQKVKRWTRKVNIFQKEYLVVPVNSNNHWNVFIILNPKYILLEQPEQNKKCKIIGLDSMSEIKSLFFDAFKIYLQLQMLQRQQTVIQTKNTPCYQILVPRQTNHHDCGLFIICYVQFLFSKEAWLNKLKYNQEINYLDLFPRQIVYPMRTQLKNLYYTLMKNSINQQKVRQIQSFFADRKRILNNKQSKDYDVIDFEYFQKYGKLSPNYAEENEQKLMVRFYLDIDINYYEQDQNTKNKTDKQNGNFSP